MATKVARKQSFNDWYERNKSKYNEARRAKYKNDPELREKYASRQRTYRITSMAEKKHFRIVFGVAQEVFRIGGVASQIGRSIDVIRQWEKLGIIPKPSIVGMHRYYTKAQVILLREMVDLIDVFHEYSKEKNRREKKDNKQALKLAVLKKSSEIFLAWEK